MLEADDCYMLPLQVLQHSIVQLDNVRITDDMPYCAVADGYI